MVNGLKACAIALLTGLLALGLATLCSQAGSQASTGCDRAYPGVCIPSPPPNLDCKDVPYQNFRVLPPDPHRFDRDRDGIGCERQR
ncbi:MAG: excalibur calcium-binding domain-containing protein [Leptolyngbyaceae cyanobacterium bins.349]|nr:excalibur calcium-binding domain-containing protein [Leptolyngbyaceae cyanobacterium bins.349]